MKKRTTGTRLRYTLGALVVVAAIVTCVRWRAWFGQPDEPPYNAPNSIERISLSLGEHGESDRYISWRCGSSASTAGGTRLVKQGMSDTLQLSSTGKIVTTRGGKAAYYRTTLPSLTAGIYKYQLIVGKVHSPWHTFRIDSLTSEGVSFVLLGDIQAEKYDPQDSLMYQISTRFPQANFWAQVGDIIERPLEKYWQVWQQTCGKLSPETPMVVATGNHDYIKGIPAQLDQRWGATFAHPQNGPEGYTGESYYTQYGPLVMMVIDTRGLGAPSDYWAHRRWIRQVTAATPTAWHVVMMHHPPYPIRKSRHEWLLNISFTSLFEEEGIDLVIAGHDHAYARYKPAKEAPLYLITNFSLKQYPPDQERRKYDKVIGLQRVYHYNNATDSTLTIRTYNELHQEVDAITLSK